MSAINPVGGLTGAAPGPAGPTAGDLAFLARLVERAIHRRPAAITPQMREVLRVLQSVQIYQGSPERNPRFSPNNFLKTFETLVHTMPELSEIIRQNLFH